MCAHAGVSRQAKEKKFLLIVSLYDLYMLVNIHLHKIHASCARARTPTHTHTHIYIYIYIDIYISCIDMDILCIYIFDMLAEKSARRVDHPTNSIPLH